MICFYFKVVATISRFSNDAHDLGPLNSVRLHEHTIKSPID